MKIAKRVLIALGVMSCAYGCIVVSLISSVHWFNFAGFIVGGVLIAAGMFLEQVRDFIRRIPKALLVVICLAILAVFTHFAAFENHVIRAANSRPDPNAQYMIILGAKVNGSTPSLEYQRRIDAALEYAQSHEDIIVICTGGKGDDEGIAESLVAYNYLLGHGIDQNRLIKEEKSTSTTENFRFAKEAISDSIAGFMSNTESAKYLREHAAEMEPSDVIIVSSAFHLYRASLIAENEGYTNLSFIGSHGLAILEPHYYLREYAAYIRELI